MSSWHYYNKNGEKVGPISATALKTLVGQGLITRETLIENHTGRTALAGEVNGLTFPETTPPPTNGEVYGLSSPPPAPTPPSVFPPQSAVVPPLENDPFTAPPPMESNPFSMNSTSSVPVPATTKGKELAQRGKEEFAKGAKEVMSGLAAAKDAVQARIKLNTLNAQLVAAYRSLGDAAEKAGWGGELCEIIRKQKAEVALMTSQQEKAAADVELAKGTPGAGVAKQVLSEAKKRAALAAGILDGLREKMGRNLLEDASAPVDIRAVYQPEITRLVEEIAECGRVIAHGKKSLLAKPMLIAACTLAVLTGGYFAWGFLSPSPQKQRSRAASKELAVETGQMKADADNIIAGMVADRAKRDADLVASREKDKEDKAREKAERAKEEATEAARELEREKRKLAEAERKVADKAEAQRITAEKRAQKAKKDDSSAKLTAAEQVEIDDFCAKYGTNVKAKGNDGWTLLHTAARDSTNLAVVKFLISQGADVNAKADIAGTPLHLAATFNSNVEVTKFLVSKGANVRAKTDKGLTPLSLAEGNDNPAVAEYLSSLEDTTTTPTRSGEEFTAAERSEISEFCANQGTNVRAKDKEGMTLLHHAAGGNHVGVAKYLVSQGADISAKADNGWTPLHYAAMFNYVEVTKFLVSHGADISAKANNGWTPLHAAASNKIDRDADVIKFLISKGADVNAKADEDWTPLHVAAQTNWNIEATKFLVSQGADVSVKDKENVTPLHVAAGSNSNIEVAKFLVSKGADAHARNMHGVTPLHQAVAMNPKVEIAKYLVSLGADVNAKNDNDGTPLHLAASSNQNVEVSRFLVSQGADVNAKSDKGRTPLHVAAGNKNVEVAKYLVSQGGDVKAKANLVIQLTPSEFVPFGSTFPPTMFLYGAGSA